SGPAWSTDWRHGGPEMAPDEDEGPDMALMLPTARVPRDTRGTPRCAPGASLARGHRPRHRSEARFRRLGPRHRHAATTELRLVHQVEVQAVVEQHLALRGVGNVFPAEQRRDR